MIPLGVLAQRQAATGGGSVYAYPAAWTLLP